MRFKYDSKEKARENYLKQIEYLKYGIVKNIEKEQKRTLITNTLIKNQ